jgi:hypothetical protein
MGFTRFIWRSLDIEALVFVFWLTGLDSVGGGKHTLSDPGHTWPCNTVDYHIAPVTGCKAVLACRVGASEAVFRSFG